MTTQLKIDFVSDVSCPWCAIGIKALERALDQVRDIATAELHFQPFELNPAMLPEGQDMAEHLAQKYGATEEQSANTRATIQARGAAVGFRFEFGQRGRIYNTFDAHRLLHWAGLHGRQRELKLALLEAYFGKGDNPSDHALLARVAGEVGLDAAEAARVLASGAYAEQVREREAYYQHQGITSVPSVIVNERYLISGGQPVEVFEDALRKIVAQV